MNHLVKDQPNLKKELKVEFIGEPAHDIGGVKKEFFQLLIRQLMIPEYTMFKQYPDS